MPAESLIPFLILFLLLVAGSALFSGIETAFFSLQDFQIRRLREKNLPLAQALEKLRANPRRLLSSVLLADTLVNLPLMLLGFYLLRELAPGIPFALKALATFTLIAGVCDLLPKILALRRPNRLSRFGVRALQLTMPLLDPISRRLQSFSEWLAEKLTPRSFQPTKMLGDEELETLVQISAEEGALQPAESEIIQEIIKLGDRKVRDCMTPRVEVFAIPDDLTNEEAIRQLKAKRYHRVPVYGDTPDDILGVLDVKMFLLNPALPYAEIMSPPSFIPETMKALDLLRSFLARPQGLAVILDEYGGTEGIITLSDLVEELISDAVPLGDHQLYLENLGNGRLLASGASRLDDLAELGIHLESNGIDTIGGLIFNHLGHLPKPGTEVMIDGVKLIVRRTSRKRIAEILLERPDCEKEDAP
jgi:CBS domain containing-hemolysin-like protein